MRAQASHVATSAWSTFCMTSLSLLFPSMDLPFLYQVTSGSGLPSPRHSNSAVPPNGLISFSGARTKLGGTNSAGVLVKVGVRWTTVDLATPNLFVARQW